MIHGYYEICFRNILEHGLWIWHMIVTWMVSISMVVEVAGFDDEVSISVTWIVIGWIWFEIPISVIG
jgi:hypothetical protein